MSATKLTLSPTITWNGKEATEGIIERVFEKPEFTRFHTIYNNIKAKEQIAFLQRFSKITKLDPGCGSGAMGKDIPMYEKFWNPADIKVWLQMCWKDFLNSLFAWTLKNGLAKQELDDTYLMAYLMDVIPDAMVEDLWRAVWFGDTDISHDGASPAGTLASSSDIVYYNLIDGLWKQIFAGVAISEGTWGHIPRYTISYNALGTEAAQLALADGYAKTVFRNVIKNADKRLRAANNKVFLVTREIFDNWIEYKESKVLETSFAREDGVFEQGVYWGVPIYPIDIWSRIIKNDFDDGTSLYLPNRVVLTTIDQIAVGFDSYDATSTNDAYLDKTTELYNIKALYKLDAKILENYMFSVAY